MKLISIYALLFILRPSENRMMSSTGQPKKKYISSGHFVLSRDFIIGGGVNFTNISSFPFFILSSLFSCPSDSPAGSPSCHLLEPCLLLTLVQQFGKRNSNLIAFNAYSIWYNFYGWDFFFLDFEIKNPARAHWNVKRPWRLSDVDRTLNSSRLIYSETPLFFFLDILVNFFRKIIIIKKDFSFKTPGQHGTDSHFTY